MPRPDLKLSRLSSLALLASLAFGAPPPAPAAQPLLDSAGKGLPTLAPLISQVTPAVVNISIKSRSAAEDNPLLRDPFFRRFFNVPDRPPQEMAAGSGVSVTMTCAAFLMTW